MARLKRKAVFNVNVALIAINVIYFIYLEIIGSTESTDFMLKHGAAYTSYILENKEYYRLVTSMFMHFGISHLANNMLVLYLLGDNLERAIGSFKYLVLYLLGGIIANVVSMYFYVETEIVSAGASGAVFAVMGGLLWCVIKNKGRLEDLNLRQIVIAMGISIFYGLTSPNVDNAAHIAGAISGFILAIVLYRKKKWGTS